LCDGPKSHRYEDLSRVFSEVEFARKIGEGMKLALWGSGGHGGVVLDAVRQQGIYEPVAFIDDADDVGDPRHRSGLPILYGRQHLPRLRADGVKGMVIALGDEAKRTTLATIVVESGFELCTIVHPSAVICGDVRIGPGTVVFAGAVVQTGSYIGQNVIINTCTSVDHDCRIGDGAQLAPRVALGGRVKLGDISFIGIGASVINHIVIGRNCLIGAGAVVVRDVPHHSVAYGVPARVVRQREPA
jgi:sugar O-acyltransferase (sialic acid O-acetyltransferase NeuD family)